MCGGIGGSRRTQSRSSHPPYKLSLTFLQAGTPCSLFKTATCSADGAAEEP